MPDPTTSAEGFAQDWSVEVLKTAPLIAPARQFIYPQQIAGEEDALARGALQLMVRPASGGMFLATCALGFTNPAMPTGVFTCPNPREMCAVAGGYAYLIDTEQPERSNHKRAASICRLSLDDCMGTRWTRVGVQQVELGRHSN